ncbi:transcription factor domain-containing protein [Aspergillus fischeri NRRL 181]|uniref:C6 zinc finger domain protein n=1 Tax=Neosartorya fischeri (strain ATCC 1020 / DSM 3700 / CBS 544.65 / FGSC A1164 / JCM 1740 / NRRL 181 / WB 181) TaxID=331117 RepID=A1DNP0_NEOFI|nr:C6 zinc finger domain protein [Aspergillus fischeri NRRL 181]EAW16411.1 C6 zinc finger domain protein [Aspergillus fischeri NRRL 181]
MAYPTSDGLGPLVSDAECRFSSPLHSRILLPLPPLLTSDTGMATKQPSRGPGAYPRRRAVRACQVCRARRTKCDNKKPACSFCEKIGAQCVVNDPTDMFDPASVLIIQRLDRIESLLQQQKQNEDSRPALENSDALATIRSASAAGDSDWRTLNSSPVYQTHSSDLSRLTIETILSWSVFEGKYDAGTPRPCCTRLLHTFLEEVHIANPILDVPLVTDYLYQACIHGIGWDAPSCLVLVICALGAISESFHEHHEVSSMTARQSPTFHHGQRYFEAAQMRLGAVLRTHGVLEAQCFFYSGVYLMAIFQPLRAWRCFVQAAATAETLLFSSGGNDPNAAGASLKSETRCLETTHWACLKSELELRLELGLNQPDPLGFTYPTFFPTLPMQQLNRDESRVWYFYLAETAVRRLTMRIVQLFFMSQTHGRFPDAHNMCEISLDFEIQASDWTTSLPPVLTLSTPEMDDDVLKFVLRGHLLDCYEWIYFPYLLEAIAHAAPRNPATDEFVVRGLAMAAERIHKNRKGFRHRHHGVWLMLRSCTRSALLLVAASRAEGGVRAMLPVGWKAAVRGAVEMLAYWRDEARDARERLRVLEEVVEGWGE